MREEGEGQRKGGGVVQKSQRAGDQDGKGWGEAFHGEVRNRGQTEQLSLLLHQAKSKGPEAA